MPLQIRHPLADGRELCFAGGSGAQASPVGNERCAVQAQPLDEKPPFGRLSDQAP